MGNGQYSKLKTNAAEDLRAIARIEKVFGVKGEVKITSYARTGEEFKHLTTLLRGTNSAKGVLCEIESIRDRGGALYVKFKDVDNRTQAELLTGHYLFVQASEAKNPPTGKYFWDDIVGCSVVGIDGKNFGTVKDILKSSMQLLYVVSTARGEVLLPAVDGIIRGVDVSEKKITVTPPEGLFDGKMAE